ncbi:MAG: arginase [Alphaproteobacteria bacterium]
MPDTLATTDLAHRTVEIIGVGSGIGAALPGCGQGPAALRKSGLEGWLRAEGLATMWRDTVAAEVAGDDWESILGAVAATCRDVADRVELALAYQHRLVVLGGDHSCAIGTWSGAARRLRGAGSLGLIWIDAHMDSHIPETSPSGTLHGMPLACLLGHGESRLTAIAGDRPAVLPQHVCLIGVRSFETAEQELLESLGVRVFYMGEVTERGIDEVLAEAVGIAGAGTAGIGLSIDLDAIDPGDAPAVGSPEPDGIIAGLLARALARTSGKCEFTAVEIVEFNPELDRGGVTAELVCDLLAAAHAGGRRHG